MSTHQKVLGNAFAQLLGKILTIGASLTIVKIISGFGAEFYGNYVTAYEFLAFFGIIADAGLFAIAVREISKMPHKTEHIMGNIFSMRLILILFVMALAGVSAQFVPSYPAVVKLGVWITAISMGLTIVAGTLSAVLQARMKIYYFSGSLVIGKILLALFVFITAQRAGAMGNTDSLLGTGLFYALLWAGVISNVVFTALVTYFARRETPIVLKFDFDWWRRTFTTSLPYGLALILQTLYLRVDIIIISIMLGSVAVGVYGVGTRILESLLILGVFFGQAILPRISAQEHDHDGGEKTLSWGMHILMLFSLPIMMAFYKFSPDIIRILSSEEYISTPGFFGSDSVMRFLIFTVFFAYFNQLFIFTLVAKNRQGYLLWVNLFAVFLNAGLNIMFLPFYGIKAAAVATILSEIVVFALLFKEILRHFRPHLWNNGMVVILFANIILGGLLFFTPLGNHIWWAAGVGSVVYFGIVAGFRKCFLPGE